MIQRLFSPSRRHARALLKQVEKLKDQQRDILPPADLDEVQSAVDELLSALKGADNAAVEKSASRLDKVATKKFRAYPNATVRENVEVLLVALAVALGVRTFFLQPFKIPTGSMQPTLYGITSTPDLAPAMQRNSREEIDAQIQARDSMVIPTGWQRIKEWFQGVSYIRLVAEADGEFVGATPPVRLLIFNILQKVRVGDRTYTLWFPPDFGQPPGGTLQGRAGLRRGQVFHKGEDIIKLRVCAGDHLFVDRVTYNFRPPKRGEVIVFATHGIEGLRADMRDTFYIKRLIGLGGEKLEIHNDYLVSGVPGAGVPVPVGNVVVDGRPLTAETPHFNNLYSFEGATSNTPVLQYIENHYYGHAMLEHLVPGESYTVEPGNLFVLGDNTMNSLDSRFWGGFDKRNVIGRAFLVYWPFTARFGWGCLNH